MSIALLATGCATDKSATSQPSETTTRSGLLQATPGYTGSKLGVEVEDVSVTGDDLQIIDLNIPLSNNQVDQIEIESVNGDIIESPKEVDIQPGPNPDNTGIRVYLPKRKNWEFRLRIIDFSDEE